MSPSADQPTDDAPLCHRCGRTFRDLAATRYIVHIEAYADPQDTRVDLADIADDAESDIKSLVELTQGRSERELMDDVHRRVTLHLCHACYTVWIEDPAGGAS